METNRDRDSNWFFWILGLIFIVLKLTDYIDWSWWWVLSPFWLYPIIATAAYLVIAMYFAYKKKRSNKR